MARQLTLAALEQLRKNPIIIPELPGYEAAETIVDPTIAPRVRRQHSDEADLVADEIFDRWLATELPLAIPAAATPTPSLAQRFRNLLRWLGL